VTMSPSVIHEGWGTFNKEGISSRCLQNVRVFFLSLSGTLAFRGARFGQGVGPIFLDQLACRGDEQHVLDCNSFLGVHMCDHTQDAGIRCIGTFISENTPVKNY